MRHLQWKRDRRRVWAAAAVAVALVLARPLAAKGDDQDRSMPAQRTDRAIRTLSLGAAGSLDLKNISGDITVTAGSGRDVSIEILRRSRGRTDADAALGLERVQVTVDQRGDRATVATGATDTPGAAGRPPYAVDVTLNVSAPPGSRITATSISGNVVIRNIKGDITAQVVSGGVEISGAAHVASARSISGDVTLRDVSGDGAASVGTVSGNVKLERVKARRIDADVVSGDVVVDDAQCDGAKLQSLSGTVAYTGTVARGGRYEVSSHSGDVRFVAAGSTGFDLEASSFSGNIAVAPNVALGALNQSKRSLRGTAGDGGAIVALTTFSGNISVGRR